ncbi:multicopper oxidase family protein [Microbispora sp. ATCC PTA-5024]|uniref:multicopper oxidase family protein n=1 Tax=Microbispora sp. ATCC PTA-5024 TaxID=316330 RepID=UPI0003DCDD36|nr:multicopper oxidase family protein [Microbispora sp. ATCC PTA-5024]ETK37710.1 multicopper oxidase [Microbispora sp. ATCC PTA-5024]
MNETRRRGARVRLAVAGAATVALLGPLVWLWVGSLTPDTYSVMDMGYADYGGRAPAPAAGLPDHSAHLMGAGMHGHAGHTPSSRSVTSFTPDPGRPADVAVTLTARRERFRLAGGRSVDGYTLNGTSPGPVIHATAGQLVQVTLVNESVPDGITLHWHGLDVPNAEDGVAGVTQEAVRVGGSFVYRFVADQAGTFWYHSHQVSHEQVRRGLLGALVVAPAARPPARTVDTVALLHLYDGARTLNGREGDVRVRALPGDRVRVRVINTENGETPVWVGGAPFRLVAVDGTDLNEPAPVRDAAVPVTAGGRADIEVTMPADGAPVRVHIGGPTGVVLGSRSYDPPAAPRPATTLDPLSYGRPAPIGFDPDRPDRRFAYEIGRRPGFLDGRPGVWWTINGHMFPDVPMFVVAEGDVVRVRITNDSGEPHPMHLHGHHAVVLARDGVPATGSPWWVDSLDVGDGETYDIAFVADNPGIWMDHCHNLPHATEGLVAHLMYEGVTTPFTVGGPDGNAPE